MKIETLDTLESVLKLCHRMRVHTIVIDGITLQLSPQPEEKPAERRAADGASPRFPEDDLLFWSSGG